MMTRDVAWMALVVRWRDVCYGPAILDANAGVGRWAHGGSSGERGSMVTEASVRRGWGDAVIGASNLYVAGRRSGSLETAGQLLQLRTGVQRRSDMELKNRLY